MPDKVAFAVLSDPPLTVATESISRGISQRCCLIIIGSCEVEYNGRARSTLTSGERILLIKEDRALLVHRSTGYEPVNWQSSGCRFNVRQQEGCLVIKAVHYNPYERLTIRLTNIKTLINVKLHDEGEFNLHVSEKELQRAIINEPSLLFSDFTPTAYEKQVEPGFIDIYGTDSDGRLVIVELKRTRAGKAAIIQLAKYVNHIKTTTPREVRGVLASPALVRGAQKTLATLGLEFIPIDLERCARVVSQGKTTKLFDFLI